MNVLRWCCLALFLSGCAGDSGSAADMAAGMGNFDMRGLCSTGCYAVDCCAPECEDLLARGVVEDVACSGMATICDYHRNGVSWVVFCGGDKRIHCEGQCPRTDM